MLFVKTLARIMFFCIFFLLKFLYNQSKIILMSCNRYLIVNNNNNIIINIISMNELIIKIFKNNSQVNLKTVNTFYLIC